MNTERLTLLSALLLLLVTLGVVILVPHYKGMEMCRDECLQTLDIVCWGCFQQALPVDIQHMIQRCAPDHRTLFASALEDIREFEPPNLSHLAFVPRCALRTCVGTISPRCPSAMSYLWKYVAKTDEELELDQQYYY
jgi:hypothetical protein